MKYFILLFVVVVFAFGFYMFGSNADILGLDLANIVLPKDGDYVLNNVVFSETAKLYLLFGFSFGIAIGYLVRSLPSKEGVKK